MNSGAGGGVGTASPAAQAVAVTSNRRAGANRISHRILSHDHSELDIKRVVAGSRIPCADSAEPRLEDKKRCSRDVASRGSAAPRPTESGSRDVLSMRSAGSINELVLRRMFVQRRKRLESTGLPQRDAARPRVPPSDASSCCISLIPSESSRSSSHSAEEGA